MNSDQLRFDMTEGISHFRKHLEDFDRLLNAEKNRINDDASKIDLDKYTDEQQHEICSLFAQEEFSVNDYTAAFHYQAIFLLIYAWFEHLMQHHFNLDQSAKNKGFFGELKDSLKRAEKYHVINNLEWQVINNLSIIRNLITHSNSALKNDFIKKKEIERFVQNNPDKIEFCGASYWFGGQGDNYPRDIKVNKKLCEYGITTFENFITAILKHDRCKCY